MRNGRRPQAAAQTRRTSIVARREEREKEEGEGEKQETQRWKAGGPQAEGAISGSKEERPAPSEPNSQQGVQTRQGQKDSHEPSLPDTTGGSEDPSKRKKGKTRGPTGGNPHGSSTCDELRQLCFAQHELPGLNSAWIRRSRSQRSRSQ